MLAISRTIRSRSALLGALPALPSLAPPGHTDPAEPGNWLAWPDLDSIVLPLTLIVVAGMLYALGVLRLSRRGARARPPLLAVGAMAGALIALGVAIASPLDRLAGALFAAHMAQHLVLVLVVAPLLVLARPHRVSPWAFPLPARRVVGRALGQIGRRAEAIPAGAAVGLYGGVLWFWHVPPMYEAAEANALVHDLEHVTLAAAAVLFWGRLAVLARGTEMAQWRAIPFLVGGMLLGLTLGLALTWAPHPWYSSHLATAPEWGLTPGEDQQLGGLLMLMPATAVQLGVLGWLLARAAATHEVSATTRATTRS